jgi:hypothetical protein
MFVRTKPGHRTDTPIPFGASCTLHPSLIATTANFVAAYGSMPGLASKPAIDEVFTMWPPYAVLRDERREDLRAVHDAHEVHADHPLPIGLGNGAELPAHTDARVVADDVHLAECRDRRTRRVLDARAARDVALHALGCDAAGSQTGERRIEIVLVDAREHHPHAGSAKRFGQRVTEAGRCACDERGLAAEVLHDRCRRF